MKKRFITGLMLAFTLCQATTVHATTPTSGFSTSQYNTNTSIRAGVTSHLGSIISAVNIISNNMPIVGVSEEEQSIVDGLKQRQLEEQQKAAEAARIEAERIETERKAQAEITYVQNQAGNVPYLDKNCRAYALSYMWYTALKGNNRQTRFSAQCYTSPAGFRMYGDRYCIAVGTAFAKHVGEAIDVEMEDGTVAKCIVGDFKSDKETDPTHRYHLGYTASDGTWIPSDGSVIEFLVGQGYRKTSPDWLKGNVVKVISVEGINF